MCEEELADDVMRVVTYGNDGSKDTMANSNAAHIQTTIEQLSKKRNVGSALSYQKKQVYFETARARAIVLYFNHARPCVALIHRPIGT